MPKFDVRELRSCSPVHKRNNGASNITRSRACVWSCQASDSPAAATMTQRRLGASGRQSSVISAIMQVRSHGVFLAEGEDDPPFASGEGTAAFVVPANVLSSDHLAAKWRIAQNVSTHKCCVSVQSRYHNIYPPPHRPL